MRGLTIQEGQINVGKRYFCSMFHLGKDEEGMLDKNKRIGVFPEIDPGY
jgi:hypothetical protein